MGRRRKEGSAEGDPSWEPRYRSRCVCLSETAFVCSSTSLSKMKLFIKLWLRDRRCPVSLSVGRSTDSIQQLLHLSADSDSEGLVGNSIRSTDAQSLLRALGPYHPGAPSKVVKGGKDHE